MDNIMLNSIRLFADQIEQAWSEVSEIKVPSSFSKATEVVICGMGGSALGGRIIDSLTPSMVRVPIEVFTEYKLPNYVGPKTLVISSSYSGNTEEALSAVETALNHNCQIFCITTGGKLAEIAEKEKLPIYIINPKNNPAKQPRMALGYSVAAVMGILAKNDFIHLPESEMKNAIKQTRSSLVAFGPHTEDSQNIAKKLSLNLKNKMPILVTSEHLVGAAHAMKNQINESAKAFALLFDLPELNHHLMEGLRNPAQAKEFWHFLFIESDLFDDRVKVRYPITKQVLDKNEISYSSCKLISNTKLEQVFELLALGSFVQYYLAELYGVDPLAIPWVDYFKAELK